MSTATRSPLTEQAEKLGNLARHLSDGRLLEPVLRRAQAGDVWSGPVHDGFLAWLQFAVDGWVRNQLAQGVRLVADALTNRAAEIDRAAQAMAAGQINVAGPGAPLPLNYSPGRPPPYGDIGGGPNSKFNPDKMTELAQLLESTADGAIIDFARTLRSALEPPPAPPPPPGAPSAISPLPPDAPIAAGDPGNSSPGANAYLALANELHNAANDIEARVRNLRLLDAPLPISSLDMSLFSNVGSGAAAGAESSTEAASDTNPQPERTPEELESARRDGAAAADKVGDIVGVKHWDDEDHEKLFLTLLEAEKHVDDPEYAVAFMKSLVPDGLAAWCKLMNNSVIDVQVEMDILRPMSRLFATATHQGDQFPPETRKALMNSRCLDTLVHYGTFEKEFALEAAHKIFDDPGYYERSDGSDRVYAGRDPRGNHEDGDARVGALRLLANNPAAAQEILETHGPEGRRLIFDALRDKGLLGKEAAGVLEAGLQNLDNKASEDTLELLIKDTADGRLKLCDYGKQAMARILSSEEGMSRLVDVARTGATDVEGYTTGDEGFRVPAGTVEKFMGKLLDDERAREDFLKGMAAQHAIRMKQEAQALGATPIGEDLDRRLGRLKESMTDFSELNQLIAAGVKDASNEKEANAFMSAGLNLAIGEAVKLVPGGFAGKFVLDKALETAGDEFITKKVLSEDEKKRVKTLDEEGLTDEMDRGVRFLTLVALISDKSVTDQLVPPDSPLRQWDKDRDGRIEMPTPPLAGTKAPRDWQDFSNALRYEQRRMSPIGRAVQTLDSWSEIYKSDT